MLNPTLVGLLLFRAKTAPKIMGKWQAGVIMMTTISPQSYFFMLPRRSLTILVKNVKVARRQAAF